MDELLDGWNKSQWAAALDWWLKQGGNMPENTLDDALTIKVDWEINHSAEAPQNTTHGALALSWAAALFNHVAAEMKAHGALYPLDAPKALQPDTAPRVTPADIEAQIAEVVYINPGDYLRQGHPASVLTICILVLKNGFCVTGESACASPGNFKTEVGREIARAHAVEKVWPLLGYELRTRLSQPVVDTNKLDQKVWADCASVTPPAVPVACVSTTLWDERTQQWMTHEKYRSLYGAGT